MKTFDPQPVIAILQNVADNPRLDLAQIDEAIEKLEDGKRDIDPGDDEGIDRVDEIQDYLQYIVTAKNPLPEEVKEELANLIHELQQAMKPV